MPDQLTPLDGPLPLDLAGMMVALAVVALPPAAITDFCGLCRVRPMNALGPERAAS